MLPDQTPPNLAQAIVSATADALVAVDASGTITAWNPAAERLLGHAAKDAIGQTLALIVPPPARPAHIDGFHRAMESGRTDTAGAPVTVVATHAGGSPVPIEMTIGLITDTAAGARGAVAALRPAGERRALASFAPTAPAS